MYYKYVSFHIISNILYEITDFDESLTADFTTVVLLYLLFVKICIEILREVTPQVGFFKKKPMKRSAAV